MVVMWIAGVWLGTNVAVVAVLVALAERGQRRTATIPPAGTRDSAAPTSGVAMMAARDEARAEPPSG